MLQNEGDRDDGTRHFHGIVQSVQRRGQVRGRRGGEQQAYSIVLVPRLWFLSQTADCRVYQKLTTVDILQKLFDEVGLTDCIPAAGQQREYTVQFNETDLQFATRLMEEEGYFYFFEHTAGSHKLIDRQPERRLHRYPGRATMHLGGGDERRRPADGLVAPDRNDARQDEVQGLRSGKARYAAAERAADHAEGGRRRAA